MDGKTVKENLLWGCRTCNRAMRTQNLIDYAQLKNNALIIGVVNKIEIWNPKLLKSAEKDFHEIKSSEFDELANQIIL